MGQETMGKKEREKKKLAKKKAKQEKRQQRKEDNNKGKKLDDMMVYLDEYGNLSDTPPDPKAKKVEIDLEDIQLGAAPTDPRELIRKGIVTHFNTDKGYGFINDLRSQESIFFHVNETSEPIAERDKVNFETEKGPRGLQAVRIVKIK